MELTQEQRQEIQDKIQEDLFIKIDGKPALMWSGVEKIINYVSSQLEPPVKPANGVTINDLKWGQNTIKIYGHEWYDNGIWKLEIFNPFDDLEFEYKINDNDCDKDYTFEEFIEEAIQKYNESRLSV